MSPLFDGPLVQPAVIASRLGRADLVVLDASAALPGSAVDPDRDHEAARIPGARRFDGELFSDPEATLPHTVPGAARFARLAGALGIDHDTDVVVYETGRPFAAPRAWFLFRLFGHDRVAVLDGGLPAWRAAELPVEHGAPPPPPPPPRRFVPRFRARLLAGLGDVADDVACGRLALLDARAAGRFGGTAPEPRPGVPSGAIPGSRNLPYDTLIAGDGRLLPADILRARFADAGADGTAPAIVSCGTGVTAAVLMLAMRVAGLPDPALFDGSWTEWANAGTTAG